MHLEFLMYKEITDSLLHNDSLHVELESLYVKAIESRDNQILLLEQMQENNLMIINSQDKKLVRAKRLNRIVMGVSVGITTLILLIK